MKLSGRRDFPFATLATQRTTLLYDQISGPTEVVRLNDGLVVLEIPAGIRRVRLGLPAGNYLIRRRAPEGVFVRLVSLSVTGATTLGEADLSRSTLSTGRVKDADAYESDGASWAGQRFYASLAIGVRHAPVIDPGFRIGAEDGRGVFLLRAAVRLTHRLWWAAPLALVYDAERPTAFNWLAWAGAPVLALSHGSSGAVVAGFAGIGFDARYRGGERHLLNASLAALSPLEFGTAWTKTLTTQATLGITEIVPDAVSFNLGFACNVNLLESGSFSAGGFDSAERGVVIALGSVQRAGLRPLPLIHVPIGRGWGIDAHAVGAYVPAKHGWVETYLAGVSWVR
jgi:hypothetical protein